VAEPSRRIGELPLLFARVPIMKSRREILSAAKQALLARRLRRDEAAELAPVARDGRDGPFPVSSGQLLST
jgi:hypothetical protein